MGISRKLLCGYDVFFEDVLNLLRLIYQCFRSYHEIKKFRF